MSVIDQRPSVRRRTASIPQVVAGALVTLAALLTVQMAALTAWMDVVARPGGMGQQPVDTLGRPLSGWAQVWATYGSALWAAYALGLLGLVTWMWRAVLTRPQRGAWSRMALIVLLGAVFWALELDRF